MIKISIIGSGNVAYHLVKTILKTESLDLVELVVRNSESVKNWVETSKICTYFDAVQDADLYIFAVSDDAIESVSEKLIVKNRLLVHTSGSTAFDVMNPNNRRGVFYPLQTFSKNKKVNFKSIPICIETEYESDFILLEKVANAISDKVYKIDFTQRKALHVAAVFVCNFVNHLYKIGSDICLENQVPFEILLPLIQETGSKIEILAPENAQTGPAKRKDIVTINSHLKFLSDENQKDIYKILTKSIIDDGKKL